MPWKEYKLMDQKLLFIGDYLRGYFSVTELCNRFGISRTTGYKWINRYLASGRPDALLEVRNARIFRPTRLQMK